jgi:DNA-binding FadR family transcriptional regulator
MSANRPRPWPRCRSRPRPLRSAGRAPPDRSRDGGAGRQARHDSRDRRHPGGRARDGAAPRTRSGNEQADRNFHLAIARATGNSALVGVIEYLWSQRGSLWHKLKEHFQTEELRQETLKDHRRIFSAIAAHDPAGARTAMRAHLDRVTRTFSRG